MATECSVCEKYQNLTLSLFPVRKCRSDWASPQVPLLRRRLGTRSLPPRAHVFVICQFVPKPCDKHSLIGHRTAEIKVPSGYY